jgi:hypothetical protein
VGLLGLGCHDRAASLNDVDAISHGLKMRRIDAAWVAAKVIQHKTLRDWANEKLIGNTVCALGSSVQTERPVAAALQLGGSPLPALAALVDLAPESVH